MKISFSPPDISVLEIREVCEALKSGWITTGPMTKRFEKNIAEMLGVNKACCLNSQTACAEMAPHILGIGEDDERCAGCDTGQECEKVAVCHMCL